MKKLFGIVLILSCIAIGAGAECLPDIYYEAFLDNAPGETVVIDGHVSVCIDQVQWMTYEEYVREYQKEDQYEYLGHCTVISMKIKNLGSREIAGSDLLDNMVLMFFNETYTKEQEHDGGGTVGWVDWETQYAPTLEAFLNSEINSVEVNRPDSDSGDSILLAETSIRSGEVAEIVAVYSSWGRDVEKDRIVAYRFKHKHDSQMISVNAPFYPFSDPDFKIEDGEFPILLVPLSEIGIDYTTFDARIEYFDGSYYGDEKQLYCDAVKELQRRCGLEETGDYDLLTRMWLNHLEVNVRE